MPFATLSQRSILNSLKILAESAHAGRVEGTIPADVLEVAPEVGEALVPDERTQQDVETEFFHSRPSMAAIRDYMARPAPVKLSPFARTAQDALDQVGHFVSKHPYYDVAGNHQVAAVGFRVPIKVQLSGVLPGPWQKSSENVPVRFFAVTPSGKTVAIGEKPLKTSRKGRVTQYFTPTEPGTYRFFYVLENGATRVSHEHGTLTVLPQDRPMVALDMPWLLKTSGKDAVLNYLKTHVDLNRDNPDAYNLIALVYSEAERDELLAAGIPIPVVINDYDSSPFRKKRCGFGETQLEKLKRLKAECGLPIVGVLGRPFKEMTSYIGTRTAGDVEAVRFTKDKSHLGVGIVPILYEGPNSLTAFQDTLISREMRQAFVEFHNKLAGPRETFHLDYLTESEEVGGNHVVYQDTNAQAREEIFRVIDEAETFIHIANYVFHNDESGSQVFDRMVRKLKEKRAQGVDFHVRIIIDRMSHGPLPTDKGFSYLDFETVDRLRAAGADVVIHHMFQKPDDDQATKGLLVRRHRKILLADFKNPTTRQIEIRAHGGGRIIGSMAYDDARLKPNWFEREIMNIGRGTFEDLSFTAYGPVVDRVQKRFLDDFMDYGGQVHADDLPSLLASQPFYPQDTRIRFGTHESFLNQNCHNLLMHLIKNPDSDRTYIINSFYPTQEIIDDLKAVAANGRNVTVYFSLFWWMSRKRNKLIAELVKAGVTVKLVPYQLHTKLYGDQNYWATGNQNLEGLSLHDTEDLWLFRVGQGDARYFDDKYIPSLDKYLWTINEIFGPESDPQDIVDFVRFVERFLNKREFTHDRFTHHGYWDAIRQLARFARYTIKEGGWSVLRGGAAKILHLRD